MDGTYDGWWRTHDGPLRCLLGAIGTTRVFCNNINNFYVWAVQGKRHLIVRKICIQGLSMVHDKFFVESLSHPLDCGTLILGLPRETEKDVDLTIELVDDLKPFKSLLVPLFLVSMGRLKNKAESFVLEKMTNKHYELYLKCWEHNLDWAPALVKDYSRIAVRDRFVRYGLKIFFSHGIKQTTDLLHRCREDYRYDLPAMIRDIRSGKIKAASSLPTRLAYRLAKLKVKQS